MTTHTSQTKLKLIHQSFQAAFDSLPAYRHMLPFFETLFTLMEAAVPVTSPPPLEVAPEKRKAKLKGQLPLMDRGGLTCDKAAALGLMRAICQEAAAGTPELASGAEKIMAGLEKDSATVERGLDMLMTDNLQGIQELSTVLSMDVSILLFFLYHSTWPSVARHAETIAAGLDFETQWDQGFCPVCGSPPGLAFLTENGGRVMVCDFCRTQWPFKRIGCVFCGNDDSESVGYFFSEAEQTYRVYTCDACKQYLKTIDTRCLARPFYPPLERIVTSHLDLKAQEMGYQSAIPETSR